MCILMFIFVITPLLIQVKLVDDIDTAFQA